MGNMPPIFRLRAWWSELTADNNTRQAQVCWYGNRTGTMGGNCDILVQPGEGVMVGPFTVYCSEEHACLCCEHAAM